MGKPSASNAPTPTSLWCSARLTMAIVAFLGFVNLYALRVNLSVAMVCMVNHTAVSLLNSDSSNKGVNITANNTDNSTAFAMEEMIVDDECGGVEETEGRNGTRSHSDRKDGEFVWSKETQGLILGSFFWGYLFTQLPGGWLASRYGGKRVYGYCMCACAIVTLLMPLAARTDYRFLMACRIVAGLCQGVAWPAVQSMWAYWAPPLETGKLAGFSYAGAQIGNVITFPVAALLCEYGFDGGWPSVFYVLGIYGLVWFMLWMFLVFDTPESHPRISPEERRYIEASLKGRADPSKRTEAIPWRAILTSKAVWAIVVTHMCANWGTYTFLTNIPTYMNEVLRFDIKKNGLLSSLPYIGFWLMINASGHLFDLLQSRRILSTTASRKISNSLGEILPALFVIGVGFMDCSTAVWGVVLLTVGVSMCGCQYGSGFIVNAGDIAPRYAGIIFGVSNTFGTIPGFLAPMAIGIITTDQTRAQWQTVFYICAAIYAFGTIFYIVFGSGQLQDWARQDVSLEVEPPLLDGSQLAETGRKRAENDGPIYRGPKFDRTTDGV